MGLLLIGFVRYPLGQTAALPLQIANIASIGLGTIFRFWAYRRWVFPVNELPVPATPEAEPALAGAGKAA
jgi:putative flippase GtrA